MLEKKTQQLENKLKQNVLADESKFKLIRDNLNTIQEDIEKEKQARELMMAKKSKEQQLLDKNFTLQLQEEQGHMELDVEAIEKALAGSEAEINADIQKLQKLRSESFDRAERESID